MTEARLTVPHDFASPLKSVQHIRTTSASIRRTSRKMSGWRGLVHANSEKICKKLLRSIEELKLKPSYAALKWRVFIQPFALRLVKKFGDKFIFKIVSNLYFGFITGSFPNRSWSRNHISINVTEKSQQCEKFCLFSRSMSLFTTFVGFERVKFQQFKERIIARTSYHTCIE